MLPLAALALDVVETLAKTKDLRMLDRQEIGELVRQHLGTKSRSAEEEKPTGIEAVRETWNGAIETLFQKVKKLDKEEREQFLTFFDQSLDTLKESLHRVEEEPVDRLVRIRSPRPGMHVYFRSPVGAESQKLAWGYELDRNGVPLMDEYGRPKKKSLVETKAEAGYCVCCPSPARCHMTNRRYILAEGSPPLTQVPVVTREERAVLIEEAKKFNECADVEPKKVVRTTAKHSEPDGNRPGDHFAREVTWAQILEPHGWICTGGWGEVEYWRRPGKDAGGNSATVNHADLDLLHVFSTNGFPFEIRSYSKFHAYALLNHNGDFNKAAVALQEEGYGLKSLPAGKRTATGGVQTISFGGN